MIAVQQQGYWIYFPSVTYANKARYYFERAGIYTRIERIPESEMRLSCGYRLLVGQEQFEQAVGICKDNGIRYLKTKEA